MKSLAKNSVFNTLCQLTNTLLPFITSMYVSRVLLTDGMGLVAYGKNIASYFVMLAPLGLPLYGVREIARIRENRVMTNQLFTELFLINLLSTVLSSAIFLCLLYSVPGLRADIFLFLSWGMQVFMNVFNIDWVYQGQEDYVSLAWRNIVIRIAVFAAVLYFVKQRSDYIIYAFISCAGICMNYLVNFAGVWTYVRFDFRGLDLRRHMKPLLMLALILFFYTAYNRTDITMLGMFSTEAQTGIYYNAHRIIEIIVNVCVAVTTAFLPSLAHCYQTDRERFFELLELGMKIICFVSIPMAAGVFVLAPYALDVVYGKEFLPGGAVIRVFTGLILLKAFGSLLCYQPILATGNEKKLLPSYVLAAAVNITLNAVLIPVLHAVGAAIASVVSEIVVFCVQFFSMRKVLRYPRGGKPLAAGVLSSAIMAGAMWLVIRRLRDALLICILGFSVGVAVYLCVNLLLKTSLLYEWLGALRRLLAARKERNS